MSANPRVLGPVRFQIRCAWCTRLLREGDPGAPTSHSICPPCAKEVTDAADAAACVIDTSRVERQPAAVEV
jgi:hypothetical protein